MYFKKFDNIYYAFDNADGTDFSMRIMKDITRNIRFRKEVLENVTLYDEYDIQEGETPEIIAEKIYGNPELHWIIMLFNERYNYANDFPMSQTELSEYILATYDNINQVHHYEKDGIIVEAKGVLNVKYSNDAYATLTANTYTGDIVIGQTSGATGIVLSADAPSLTINVQLDTIPFINGEAIILNGLRLNENTDEYEYGIIDQGYLNSTNAFEYTDNYDIVTNEMYEERRNESKRRIKLIDPSLVSEIVALYEEME